DVTSDGREVPSDAESLEDAVVEVLGYGGLGILSRSGSFLSAVGDLCPRDLPEYQTFIQNCDDGFLGPYRQAVEELSNLPQSLESASEEAEEILRNRGLPESVTKALCCQLSRGIAIYLEVAPSLTEDCVRDSPEEGKGSSFNKNHAHQNEDDDVSHTERGCPLTREEEGERILPQSGLDPKRRVRTKTRSSRRPSNRTIWVAAGAVAALSLVFVSVLLIRRQSALSSGLISGQQVEALDEDQLVNYAIGCWQFCGSIGWTEDDYSGYVIVSEDGTASIQLDELSSPNADGSQTVLGTGDPQPYTWEVKDSGIVLHPIDSTDAFDGGDIVAVPYPRWVEKDNDWTHALRLNNREIVGCNANMKRAGWNKHLHTDTYDVYQVRDMDVIVGDNDYCTIKVVCSGYGEHGDVGYLLEVTNKTAEEIDIYIDSLSYDNWTIAGQDVSDPSFSDYSVASAKNNKPTTKLIFMYFYPSYPATDGS
ncbi:MAG: hypothetical protein Q4C09_00245, partial [Atopobiaceae bacterium]|nr:hypothetical protein [Atopobiaceae bacterium]